MTRLSRRSALALGGSSLAAALAGCLDALVSQEQPLPTKSPRQFQYDAQNTGATGTNAPRKKTSRWQLDRSELGPEAEPIDGLAVADDRLLVTTNDELHVIDPEDGSKLWATEPGNSGGKPAVADDTVYVTRGYTPDSEISALDLTDGSERWRSASVYDVTSAPTLVDDTIYVTILRDREFNTGAVLALDAGDGSIRWEFDEPGQMASTPAVADGTVYVGGGNEPIVYALDAASGEILWIADTGGWMRLPPTVVGDTVYVPSDFAERLYAFDTADGTERWSVGLSVTASVAATTDTVYVPTYDGVAALDSEGETRWLETFSDTFLSNPPVVAGDTLCVTGERALCLDRSDGSVHWEQTVKEGTNDDVIVDSTSCEPIVADDAVFVGTAAGDVYAIGA
jgi:outer membrane protein assembly factor BamB